MQSNVIHRMNFLLMKVFHLCRTIHDILASFVYLNWPKYLFHCLEASQNRRYITLPFPIHLLKFWSSSGRLLKFWSYFRPFFPICNKFIEAGKSLFSHSFRAFEVLSFKHLSVRLRPKMRFITPNRVANSRDRKCMSDEQSDLSACRRN